MANYKVYDLAAAGSYLIGEVRVGGYSDGYLGNFSLVLRCVGDLYVPDPVPGSFFVSLRRAIYSSIFDSLGLGSLQPDAFRSGELHYSPPDLPSLSDFFDFAISSFPSRFRLYQEPEGGERFARYHVVRVSVESLTASLLLVDEPAEGDGVIAQIYFPLRSVCAPIALKGSYE